MKEKILHPAKIELKEIVDYYNEQCEGLGYEFALEFDNTVKRILQFPEAWIKITNNTRFCRTNRFPYKVVYLIESDLIIIIAIAHFHRKPLYWKNRLK